MIYNIYIYMYKYIYICILPLKCADSSPSHPPVKVALSKNFTTYPKHRSSIHAEISRVNLAWIVSLRFVLQSLVMYKRGCNPTNYN